MKEKLFKKFRQTGLIKDYLKYRLELGRELNDRRESRNNNSRHRLQGK